MSLHGMDNDEARRKAAKWREKWLGGIKMGETYDLDARDKAASWATKWGRESWNYQLHGFHVSPFCSEMVLEPLQLHGGRPILPVKIDRLEDITIGVGAGISMQGEICGAVVGHIIAIGIDVAYRLRETALIRKEVSTATRKFCNLFKEKFGALRCADLIGMSFLKADGTLDPDALEKYVTGSPPISAKCEDIIRFCIYVPLPSEEG